MQRRFQAGTSSQLHSFVAFLRLRFRASKPTRFAPGLLATHIPNPPRTLGDHLLVARFDRGLRQEDVARELGVAHASVHNWETGKREPELRFLPLIYQWLGYCPVRPAASTLGQKLRRWREGNGLSRKVIASRLGLESTTLWRLETADRYVLSARVSRIVTTFLANQGQGDRVA